MLKGIKAFLLSVLTIGSLVATGNMVKSQETKVAEAAGTDTWNFSGGMNSWGETKLTYNPSTHYYELTQEFKSGANQWNEFKIKNGSGWSNAIEWTGEWATSRDPLSNVDTYCTAGSDGNIKIRNAGFYKLSVKDDNVANYGNKSYGFKIEKVADVVKYKVNFSVKGSIIPELAEEVIKGEKLETLPFYDFSSSGERLEGWYTSSELTSSTKVTKGKLTINSETTLYAKTESAKEDFTVYVKKPSDWTHIYVYMFRNALSGENSTWPGVEVTKRVTNDINVYYLTVKDADCYDTIIFNAGDGQPQTENLDLSYIQHKVFELTKPSSGNYTGKLVDYYTPEEKTSNKATAIETFNKIVNNAVKSLEKYKSYSISSKGDNFIGKTTKAEIEQLIETEDAKIKNAKTELLKSDSKRDNITEGELNTDSYDTLKVTLEEMIKRANVKVYAQSQSGDDGKYNIRFWGTVDDLDQDNPQYSSLGFKIIAKKDMQMSEEVIVSTNSMYTSVTYRSDEEMEVTLQIDEYDTAGFFLFTLTDVPSDVTEFDVTPFAKRIDQEIEDQDCGLKQTFKFTEGKLNRA